MIIKLINGKEASFLWTKFFRIMKLMFLFFFVGFMQVYASVYSQDTKLTLNMHNKSVSQVLDKIESQTEYRFAYNTELIDMRRKVTVIIQDKTVDETLAVVFDNTGVKYVVQDRHIMLYPVKMELSDDASGAQQEPVSGKVVDEAGEAIPGATVMIKGTSTGTITNTDGYFSISDLPEDAVLIFSFIGLKTQEIAVGNKTTIDVTLESDITDLNEVVVVGYGIQKKKLTTGANLNVKGGDIAKLTPTNPIDALQGISPGVNITQSSGQPGVDSKVYIRGIGTTGNSAPLYIVDGVTVGNIDYLNAADIESIDVLKDAASSAIYGSRAANGVILVTTKKGKKGVAPVVSYDTHFGWQNIVKDPNVLNAQDYATIISEQTINDGFPEPRFDVLIPDWGRIDSGGWTGTDWFNEIVKEDALIQNHALNIIGGTDRSVYSMGASYTHQDGVLGKQAKSYYKKYNLRLNTEHVIFRKSDRDIVTIGQNLTYTNTENPSISNGSIWNNTVRQMINASPLQPVYDEDGNYSEALAYWTPMRANPIAQMALGKDQFDNSNAIIGNVYLEIEPIKNLTIRSSYGINSWFGSWRAWRPAYDLAVTVSDEYDKVTQSVYHGNNWTFTNTANYKFDLGKHHFTTLLGQEMQKVPVSVSINGSNQNSIFQDADHAYLDNVLVVDPMMTTLSGKDSFGWAMMSYFGRLSYDYDEKYMFTAVLRGDGTSNFIKGERWGIFPSVSAGWNITNESFMEGASWLDYFKFRGSWGQNGNQDIGAFQYSSSIRYDGTYFFGPDKAQRFEGAYPGRVPNTNITWETSEQLNFGFDTRFFSSRMQLNLDWYRKDTKDWLVNPPALATIGTGTPDVNGGRVTNQGVEIAFRWNDNLGDFRYGISASLAYNQNEVTEIANDEKIIHGSGELFSHGPEFYRAEVGMPIGYFWGYKTEGVIQNDAEAAAWVNADGVPYYDDILPGDLKFVDLNEDGEINESDKTMIGNPNPDYIFGFQVNLGYKGLYLNATLTGQAGHQIAKSYHSAALSKENFTYDIMDRWHGEGTSNTYPRLGQLTPRNWQEMSDIYIEDASFVKVSNVTLGYNLSELFKNMPLTDFSIYVTAKNFLTFTNYSGMDPEVGYGPTSWSSGVDLGLYPQSKTFLVGLSAKF